MTSFCYSESIKKPSNSTILNVCIAPDERVSKACEKISQSLNSGSEMFTLGGNRFAHMTVFMARFANENIDEVIGTVEQTIKGVGSFTCDHTGYFMTEGRYLEVSYRKSEQFMQLHEALINKVSPLRINPGKPYEEGYFTPYSSEQRLNAVETGYDLARSLYRPHITLTRYEEDKVPNLFPAFPEVNLSFRLSKLCVFKADDNGGVYEKLAKFLVK